IFIISAQVSTSILNGVGRTFAPLFAIIIGCIIKVALGIMLIPNPDLNIKAAAISTLISYLAISLIDFILVIKYTRVYTKITECFIMPLVCSLIMGFAVMFSYSYLFEIVGRNSIATLMSIVIGAVIYILTIFITKTLSIKEIKDMMRD
ncbi:MAG: polysaccharide biosynthesis C-terminal domain-containing protein, partial [Clostridium sp.]